MVTLPRPGARPWPCGTAGPTWGHRCSWSRPRPSWPTPWRRACTPSSTGPRAWREYLRSFRFKVLHFLLTEALKDLRSTWSQPRCLHVYRGVTVCFVTSLGQIVCFGQFASTSLLKNISLSYGTSTVFEVETCYGADIRHFSDYPEEEEVLIPPFETFKVTNVTHEGNETYIHLRSHGVHSNYNCTWFRGDVPEVGTLQLGWLWGA